MPHIIVEHSANLNTDIPALLLALHDNLAAQDTVSKERIKTRSIKLDHCVIGNDPAGTAMIHITLKLMPGRPDELRKKMAQDLKDTAQKHVPDCKVTAEVMLLDEPSYCA